MEGALQTVALGDIILESGWFCFVAKGSGSEEGWGGMVKREHIEQVPLKFPLPKTMLQ